MSLPTSERKMQIGDSKEVYSYCDPACPNCGAKICCEMDRSGEIECERCGAVFEYEISFSWTLTLKEVLEP